MSIVAIDGPTGVGKSTTARRLAAALDCPLLLDPVSVNPLLDDYYTGSADPAAALTAELVFLRSRAALLMAAPADQPVVADFSVMRTAPFAEFLDDPGDRQVVLDEMHDWIERGPRPGVLVLLSAEPAALLARVRARDREAEGGLTIDHLVELRRHFAAWSDSMRSQADEVIDVDTSEWDPRRHADLDALAAQVRTALAS